MHSGQRCPTGVAVMHSGQIGRPQFEQASAVSRSGMPVAVLQIVMGAHRPASSPTDQADSSLSRTNVQAATRSDGLGGSGRHAAVALGDQPAGVGERAADRLAVRRLALPVDAAAGGGDQRHVRRAQDRDPQAGRLPQVVSRRSPCPATSASASAIAATTVAPHRARSGSTRPAPSATRRGRRRPGRRGCAPAAPARRSPRGCARSDRDGPRTSLLYRQIRPRGAAASRPAPARSRGR